MVSSHFFLFIYLSFCLNKTPFLKTFAIIQEVFCNQALVPDCFFQTPKKHFEESYYCSSCASTSFLEEEI